MTDPQANLAVSLDQTLVVSRAGDRVTEAAVVLTQTAGIRSLPINDSRHFAVVKLLSASSADFHAPAATNGPRVRTISAAIDSFRRGAIGNTPQCEFICRYARPFRARLSLLFHVVPRDTTEPFVSTRTLVCITLDQMKCSLQQPPTTNGRCVQHREPSSRHAHTATQQGSHPAPHPETAPYPSRRAVPPAIARDLHAQSSCRTFSRPKRGLASFLPPERDVNNRQAREFATIVNSRTFLRTHNLDTGPFASVARTLDDVIRRVHQAAPSTLITRGAPGRLIQSRVTALRREHMIPISRRGKVIFRGEPRIEAVLRVPHARSQPAVIVAAAKRMIERLTPHKKLFVAEGFAPSFLTELRMATKQLADAIKAGDRLGAQAPVAYLELKRQIARGRAEVGVADGIMIGWLERQTPSTRSMRAAQWRRSHRITARIGRPRKTSAADTALGETQGT